MQRVRSIAACAITFLTLVSPALGQRTQAPTTTLDRIKAAGTIRLGYRADAQPFSFRDGSGAGSSPWSFSYHGGVVGKMSWMVTPRSDM